MRVSSGLTLQLPVGCVSVKDQDSPRILHFTFLGISACSKLFMIDHVVCAASLCPKLIEIYIYKTDMYNPMKYPTIHKV